MLPVNLIIIMIQVETNLKVADNSGAKIVRCIKVLGGSKRRFASVGDEIVVSVRSGVPRGRVKKGQVCRAIIVRSKFPVRRVDGVCLSFDENAVVIIDKQGEPIGTRVFGAISREVKMLGYNKLASLAPEVL